MASNGLVYRTWNWLVQRRTNYSKAGLFSFWYLCGIERFEIVCARANPPALARATERRALHWTVPWHEDGTFAVMEIQTGFTSQSTFGTGIPRTAWWRQLCIIIGRESNYQTLAAGTPVWKIRSEKHTRFESIFSLRSVC